MRKLSVLVIHNYYRQSGGEDAVVRAEIDLLRRAGHRVIEFTRDNSRLVGDCSWQNLPLVLNTTWNRKTYAELKGLLARERPDIAHCHNLLPQVSPAAYYACRSAGVPVVQTLHNYRLFCPTGAFYRQDHICEDCTRNLMHGVRHGCYRDSRAQTATVALMLAAHRLCKTYRNTVSAYILLTESARERFIRLGIPQDKVHIKPNFLASDPGQGKGPGDYALFVGRLSEEKGFLEMLEVWRKLPHIPLVVVGGGTLYQEGFRKLKKWGATNIKLLGPLNHEATLARIKAARFLVFPSRWYEPFGMALLEASACGLPVVATRIGGVPELVIENQTGLLFDPLNAAELAEQAAWAWDHPQEMRVMGQRARENYLRRYTAEKNYELLMNIYASVVPN